MNRSFSHRRLRRAAAATALVLVTSLVACKSADEKFREHISRAESYLAEGKDKEALLELKSALQANPKSSDASFRVAEVMSRQGKSADAVFFYREAYRLDPNRTEAALKEAGLLIGDDRARAKELVAEVMKKEPQNALARVRLSELALLENDVDEALAQAMAATELDPKSGLYFQHLGRVQQARIREARLQGKDVPDDWFQKAATAYEKADATDGPYWGYRLDVARVYASWPGKAAEADASFRKAVEQAIASKDKNADLGALKEAADYATRVGDAVLGRWTLETLVKTHPEHIPTWVELARLDEQEGGPAKGEAVLQRLVAERATDLAAHVAYATWLAAHERADDAVKQLRGAIDQGVDRVSALGAVANLYFRLGRVDDASAVADEMQRELPTHARTALVLAQVAISRGDLQGGAKILRELTANVENADAQRMLAFVELNLNNLPAAMAAVNRGLELNDPATTNGLVQLQAQVQFFSGDCSGAVQAYRKLVQQQLLTEPLDRVRFAQCLFKIDRPEAGRRQLEALIADGQAPVEAYLELAFREAPAKPARARELLEQALAKFPDEPRAIDYLTILDVREGKPAQALERLNAVFNRGRAPAQLVLVRARLLASLKQWDLAEQDALKVFEAAPSLPGVAEVLVSIYRAQGKTDAAIASLEQMEKAGSLGGAQLHLLGRLHSDQGRTDRAIALFEQALATQPDLAAAKNDLAYELALQGRDLERALTLAQEAQQASGESPGVADTIGVIYLKKGLVDAAIQQHRYALELSQSQRQGRGLLHYHLGLALRAANRHEDAIAELEKALADDPDFAQAEQVKRELESLRAAAATGQTPS